MNNNQIRFSSVKDFFSSKINSLSYNMVAPYSDTYKVSFKRLKNVVILNKDNKELINATSDFEITLNEGEEITLILNKDESVHADIKVMAKAHKAVLPYEPYNMENTRKLRTHGDDSVDPLKEVEIATTKRDDGNGIYINCNNPEKLTQDDVGKALSRVDVSNKKVFFTFEHNSLDNCPFYIGYQVKNTSDEDIYVTVLNMGLHSEGKGCWLGEKEWVDFYNLNFRYDGSHWSDKQKETFVAYFNFSNEYKAPKNQPITYRIPKGKYIYVMGGTTKDAYKHINVWKTADTKVKGACSNGVVLFDVKGQAEASFFIYTDEEQIKDNNTHQGYITDRNGKSFGSQYVGYDDCHGVVDTHFKATFNDLTPSQNIKVKFDNYYDDNLPEEKDRVPFMELNSTPHTQVLDYWVTHINPQNTHEGVGTDMTKYNTVFEGKPICIDADHLDGYGHLANIGNWMIDYMDYFTLVNQGDKDREVTIKMTNCGSVCTFIRDRKGKVLKSSPNFTIDTKPSDKDESYALRDDFEYTVVVKAHSIKQFIVEYNLLANSYGYVKHIVHLK